MHIKEKVTGLWARRPRLSGTQGRALKGVAQFFAAMLVCTLIARGTAYDRQRAVAQRWP